ncbi:phage holin, LLH family [Alicyclobacillus sp. ALC3]|uniref:phage holin, LLH family n=1 Tax=Alicyclobacillus sp. ALC3 TaxID=2796143 RepID=UPI002379CFC4|nr:phage holin, LLH family [Alicyclobacillus sp. ALC3]WDL95992.1 hypothetical protein JC200_16815 [Alicyclobacillus sp. ALC3]
MQQIWMNVLDRAVLVLLQLVIISLLVLLHRSMPMLKRWLDSHTTLKERQVLGQIGREAFRYAEAAFSTSSGQERLSHALSYASTVASRQGLHLSESELRAAIEQAVSEAKQLNTKSSGPSPGQSA